MNESSGVALAQQYAAVGQQAMACTNVGQSHDAQDLLSVFDELLAVVMAECPPLPCRNGCNQCCYEPPLVTTLEWQALQRAIGNLPAEQRAAIAARAETQRPLAHQFAKMRARLLEVGQIKSAQTFRVQCPLLIDGHCSVYEARPLSCRGYGHTYHANMKVAGERAMYWGCELAAAHVVETWSGHNASLPRFTPYQALLQHLNQRAGGQLAFITEWLWAAADGQLPELDTSDTELWSDHER